MVTTEDDWRKSQGRKQWTPDFIPGWNGERSVTSNGLRELRMTTAQSETPSLPCGSLSHAVISSMRFLQLGTWKSDGSRSNQVPVDPYVDENPWSIRLNRSQSFEEYRYLVNARDQRFSS